MIIETIGEAPSARVRLSTIFDRAENIYLRVLRVTILILATLLILYTAYLVFSGLYRIGQSPDSVRTEVANVVANEIVDAEEITIESRESAGEPVANASQRKFYADYVARYYKLFRTRFEPFRQPTDKILTRDEFDDNFVQSAARLQSVAEGMTDFAKDSADLESLLATMSAAAAEPKTGERLKRYRSAKKVPVKREVTKTRTEYRSGWNVYSTNCEGWYYSPVGCAERRAVQVPYTDTVTVMEFPKGTQSHSQIFRAMQDRYFSLLESRRTQNAEAASDRRFEIVAGQAYGRESLATALQIFAGFIALMFFFLLIAIERHQRRISAALPPDPKEAVAA